MKLLLIALFIGLAGHGHAGCAIDTTDNKSRNQSIRVHISTIGLGLFYSRTVSPAHRLSLRTGLRYVAYRKPVNVRVSPDRVTPDRVTPESYLRVVPDFMIGMVEAGLTWYPFRQKSLFLTAGAGYTWHPNLSFVITAEDKLNFDGLELTPADVGTIDLDVRWRPVVGYVGWGFARMIPRKRLGVGFEMGVHYLGRPSVRLGYDGFLETTNIDQQVPIVEQNLSGYRYLPAISLTFAYALNRTR